MTETCDGSGGWLTWVQCWEWWVEQRVGGE